MEPQREPPRAARPIPEPVPPPTPVGVSGTPRNRGPLPSVVLLVHCGIRLAPSPEIRATRDCGKGAAIPGILKISDTLTVTDLTSAPGGSRGAKMSWGYGAFVVMWGSQRAVPSGVALATLEWRRGQD